MNKFTTIRDAINWLADALSLDTDGAQWVYENTSCPDWDDSAFTEYDFFADPKIEAIPAEFVS